MKKTGWIFTDTVNFTECPKCKAKPTEQCKTPKGRKTWPPHVERILIYGK